MNKIRKRGLMATVGLTGALVGIVASRPSVRAALPPVEELPAGSAVLRGEVLSAPEDLALPTALAAHDGRLIVIDRYGTKAVRVFAATDGRQLAAFGTEGEGPGEFRGARSITFDPEDPGAFWIYDLSLARLTRYALDEPAGSADDWQGRILALTLTATVTEPVWMSPDRLLALGFFEGGRLALIDGAGGLTGFAGRMPPSADPVPAPVLLHAYQGRVKVSPNRQRVAVAARHAGRIEMYDGEGRFAGLVDAPVPFEPTYEIVPTERGPRMGSGGDLRFGYVDLAVTDDRIYALFSGRRRVDYPDRANFGESVHVFDWAGKLLDVVRLDAEVIAIAVDGASRHLYAIRHLPTPAVLDYPLAG